MKKAFGPYRRLARGLFSCSSLWLAADHLLYVRGTGVLVPFAETYLRWPLAKVTAITLRPTAAGKWWNAGYGVVAAIFLGMALMMVSMIASAGGPGADVAGWVVGCMTAAPGVLALVLLGINMALGPTCEFVIHTPGRLDPIRAVRRLRSAERMLAGLAPVLAAAQVQPEVAPAAGLAQTGDPPAGPPA